MQKSILYSIIFINTVFSCVSSFKDESLLDGQLTFVIEDNLENELKFSPRTTIHIKSVKLGTSLITHTRKWTDFHDKQLKKLSDNDGIYQIRIAPKDEESETLVSTFTKACLLYESGLSETLSVMLDNAGASVISVGLYHPISVCNGLENLNVAGFNSTVIARLPMQAPVPETATFIQQMESKKKEKVEGKDNRSFLGKYWMYIIPVVLILMFTGNQEGPPR